jgi:hypothetical protein
MLFWDAAYYIFKIIVHNYYFINVIKFISICYIHGSSYINCYFINLITLYQFVVRTKLYTLIIILLILLNLYQIIV